MLDYIYLIHPFREGFFENPTAEEGALVEAHFEYLRTSTQDGQVVLAGPCLDQTFGLVVFHARDETSAREFMMNDPTVKNNVMLAELHPFKISLPGKA
jgi:uncharacterized protein YciI